MLVNKRFLNCAICRDLEATVPANRSLTYMMSFIKLLVYCEEGSYFNSKKDLTKIGIGETVGSFLWDFCIQKDILRQTECGYTAMPYLLRYRLVTEKMDDTSEVEFIDERLELKDIGISPTSLIINKILKVYDGKDLFAIVGLYYLRNWMAAKRKKGLLVDNFDAYKALTTWVCKTVSAPDFDRASIMNHIETIDTRKTLDEFIADSVSDNALRIVE